MLVCFFQSESQAGTELMAACLDHDLSRCHAGVVQSWSSLRMYRNCVRFLGGQHYCRVWRRGAASRLASALQAASCAVVTRRA